MRLGPIALALATPIQLYAQTAQTPQVSSGVYILSEQTDGELQRLDRGDGAGKLAVGEKLAARFDGAAIMSDSNDNRQLRLSVQCLTPPRNENKRLVIVLAGKAFYVTSLTRADGRLYLQTDVAGPAVAQAIAAELNIKSRFRTHPGHAWVVSLRPDKESYRIGEPIALTLSVKNVGQTTFAFTDGGLPRGWRNNQFEFIAFRHLGFETPVPDTGNATLQVMESTPVAVAPDSAPVERPRFVVLKPGEEFTKVVNLTDWFKFDQADSYRIRGMFHVLLKTPDDARQILWEDCAVGQCTFRVFPAEEIVSARAFGLKMRVRANRGW